MELGETIREAAIREIKEETNLDLNQFKISKPFSAIDFIQREHEKVKFHFVINQVVAVMKEIDSSEAPCFGASAGSDVDLIRWADFPDDLLKEEKLTPRALEISSRAFALLEANQLDFS